MAKRTDDTALEPFTLPHFLSFASRLVLDTDDFWHVEGFQTVMFKPILYGVKETWTIIPEANTKTTSMAGFGLYHCMFTRSPWVPIVASSRDQAEIMAQQAYGIIRATPGLEYNRRTHTGYFRIFEGYRQIRNVHAGGRGIKVYAADVGTTDGGIPTLVLCDEGHRWPSLQPYRLWKGKLGKRHGQIGMTSTAGEPGSEFEEQLDKLRESAPDHQIEGAFGRHWGPNFSLTEWRVRAPELCNDMEAVKEANPFSGVTVEGLREEYDSPTTDLGDWKRLKPLAVDTPIPTPTGWTTMLEVEVGDQVLSGDGLPTTVTAATPVKFGECFEITFSDGATLRATGDHLWEVEDARNHHRPKVVSTEEMFRSPYMSDGRGQPYARWRVRTAGRYVSPDVELPIDPYVLGVWLGDGSNNTGHIRNGDSEVWAEIEARGYELGSLAPSLQNVPSKRMQTLLRLRPILRVLGLLNDKHIPGEYLVASEEARWELMQGLMDADGTVLGNGRAMFWNTNHRLATDVRRLAWSLGRPCILREDRALLDGVDYGPRFCLEIPCDERHPVVRLPRKRRRLRRMGKTCDHRRVRSVVPVGTELVRCIGVEDQDHLFLAGEAMIPTHNCNIPARTTLSAITEVEWARAYINLKIPEGVHIDTGADVAWKHDTFAIQPLWRPRQTDIDGLPLDDDFDQARLLKMRIFDLDEILTPPRDGSTMHPDVVKEAFIKVNDRNPIDTVVIDLERAEDIAAWLQDELGITLIDRGQGNALAAEDYEAFMKGLRNGTLRHTGRPGLRKHAMNAIARNLPHDKRRFDRPSQSRAKRRQEVRVIDCLTAGGMVNWYADQLVEEEPAILVAWR